MEEHRNHKVIILGAQCEFRKTTGTKRTTPQHKAKRKELTPAPSLKKRNVVPSPRPRQGLQWVSVRTAGKEFAELAGGDGVTLQQNLHGLVHVRLFHCMFLSLVRLQLDQLRGTSTHERW